jgi:hypothetical protein
VASGVVSERKHSGQDPREGRKVVHNLRQTVKGEGEWIKLMRSRANPIGESGDR